MLNRTCDTIITDIIELRKELAEIRGRSDFLDPPRLQLALLRGYNYSALVHIWERLNEMVSLEGFVKRNN